MLVLCTLHRASPFDRLFRSTNARCTDTCQTITSLSLTPDRVVSGHPIHCRVSFDVHTTRMVTGALPLQGRGSGTLCRLNCNNVALSDNLNGV